MLVCIYTTTCCTKYTQGQKHLNFICSTTDNTDIMWSCLYLDVHILSRIVQYINVYVALSCCDQCLIVLSGVLFHVIASPTPSSVYDTVTCHHYNVHLTHGILTHLVVQFDTFSRHTISYFPLLNHSRSNHDTLLCIDG